MARKKSGGEGGNAILVIFLVLFILLSIGLGVAYWTGQETVAKAKQDSDEATKKVNAEKDAKELAELKMKLYKALVGTATEDDKKSIQSPGKHAGELQKEHETLLASISGPNGSLSKAEGEVRRGADGRVIEANAGPFTIKQEDLFVWPWPTANSTQVLAGQPTPGPLLDRMVKVVAERERMFYENQMAKKNADSDSAQYKAEKDKYAKALTDLSAKVDAQIKVLNDSITKVETEKKEAIEKFEKAGADSRKGVAEKAREAEEFKTQLTEANERQESYKRQLETILAIKAEADQDKKGVFAINLPHGEIVSRKPGSTSVEISIGSDAGLRPGQTFTIQPLSARTEGLTRQRKTAYDSDGRLVVSDELASKGSIEVIEVLGPRLASARITDESDQIRNSILKGDLLYNPLFKKNAKEHVVLVGVFDTNADGLDDITEVARNLAKRGAIVDGYFDLGTNKWESLDPKNTKPGPGVNTTYVVRGWAFDTNVGDGLATQKAELFSRIQTAVNDAKLKGAQEVKAAKFLAEIGYAYSPSISDETTSAAAVKYMKDAAPPPPAPK